MTTSSLFASCFHTILNPKGKGHLAPGRNGRAGCPLPSWQIKIFAPIRVHSRLENNIAKTSYRQNFAKFRLQFIFDLVSL
jgi:hypothetical protein